jgi:hypothetical protein
MTARGLYVLQFHALAIKLSAGRMRVRTTDPLVLYLLASFALRCVSSYKF